jgi:hypothetical protein
MAAANSFSRDRVQHFHFDLLIGRTEIHFDIGRNVPITFADFNHVSTARNKPLSLSRYAPRFPCTPTPKPKEDQVRASGHDVVVFWSGLRAPFAACRCKFAISRTGGSKWF